MTFYGDLILSRSACENKIVLWRIHGFSSEADPPTLSDAPIPRLHELTRSAFGDGYERLLQFHTPDVDPFYLRFSLFQAPFKHPILAMGNTLSTVFLWDLRQLIDCIPNGNLSLDASVSAKSRELETHPEMAIGSGDDKSPFKPSKTHDISDPFGLVHSHRTITIPRANFTTRQIAWSTGGEWMVAVGEHATMALFCRWGLEEEGRYVQNGSRS